MRCAALKASTLVVPVTKAAKVSDGSSPTEEVKPCVADRAGRVQQPRAIGTVIRRAAAEAVMAGERQVGQLAAAGMDQDAHIAHFAARNLPGKRKAVRESVRHPVGRKFRRQEQFERARFLAEGAQLDRPDPLAVQLMAQVLAQALADIRPIGGQVQSFLVVVHVISAFTPFGGGRCPVAMRSHPYHSYRPAISTCSPYHFETVANAGASKAPPMSASPHERNR